jgi:GNAT superfamily N-acetyltransferase
MSAVALRAMTNDDAPAVLDCMVASFADLDRRLGLPPTPPPPAPGPALVRIRHLVGTDPGGAWVAVDGDRVVGAALGIVREGIWGLSLLVVEPGAQSGGAGSALMRAALGHGAGTRGGIILASEDARALRLYARSGFDLRPAMDARGKLRGPVERPATVRPGRWPQDRDLVDAVGRAVRGAGHGVDVPAWLAAESELLVHDGGGFAVHSGGGLRVLAAERDEPAADLLRAVLARVPEGEEVRCDFVTAGQDWAVEVLLEAGAELRPAGAIFTRGEVGPMRPYLPSGAYL